MLTTGQPESKTGHWESIWPQIKAFMNIGHFILCYVVSSGHHCVAFVSVNQRSSHSEARRHPVSKSIDFKVLEARNQNLSRRCGTASANKRPVVNLWLFSPPSSLNAKKKKKQDPGFKNNMWACWGKCIWGTHYPSPGVEKTTSYLHTFLSLYLSLLLSLRRCL